MGSGPTVGFVTGELRLELIAAQILWQHDAAGWAALCTLCPGLGELSRWDSGKVEQCLRFTHSSLHSRLAAARDRFAAWWAPVEAAWYHLMAAFVGSPELLQGAAFVAQVGIGRTFPRDIKTLAFLLPFDADQQQLLRVCAHETSHFFFYHRLFELYPERAEEITACRRTWLASEIVVPLLLTAPVARPIVGHQQCSTYVCDGAVLEQCRPLVEQTLANQVPFYTCYEQLLELATRNPELYHA